MWHRHVPPHQTLHLKTLFSKDSTESLQARQSPPSYPKTREQGARFSLRQLFTSKTVGIFQIALKRGSRGDNLALLWGGGEEIDVYIRRKRETHFWDLKKKDRAENEDSKKWSHVKCPLENTLPADQGEPWTSRRRERETLIFATYRRSNVWKGLLVMTLVRDLTVRWRCWTWLLGVVEEDGIFFFASFVFGHVSEDLCCSFQYHMT